MRKEDALNKLNEGDAQKQLKDGGCPEDTQGIVHTLKQTHSMAS